jgi:hypothetical protein
MEAAVARLLRCGASLQLTSESWQQQLPELLAAPSRPLSVHPSICPMAYSLDLQLHRLDKGQDARRQTDVFCDSVDHRRSVEESQQKPDCSPVDAT